MKIHHLRNATFIIESGSSYILVDPMLSGVGELPPFAYFRHKLKRNPLVPLPKSAITILNQVTHCLVTHSQKWGIELLTHADHFDEPGKSFLHKNKIPIACRQQDASYMEKNGIIVEASVEYWKTELFSSGRLTGIPALHGHSWMHNFMANGAGFFMELPDEPSIYISGDTVYTADVERALTELKPDVTVVAAGSASLDVGGPILMPMDELVTFIQKSPNKVIANHMEALNHCPTTRLQLKQELEKNSLLSKTFIPNDGDTFTVEKKQ
jgi:L-ascorbate metabolism protein UlaG (beta-lactamase superfamily)